MSVPMKSNDPAYFLLEQGLDDPSKRTGTNAYRAGCYICEDPEFSLMGLPLCRSCPCGGHIPADDVTCDDCGQDDPAYVAAMEGLGA